MGKLSGVVRVVATGVLAAACSGHEEKVAASQQAVSACVTLQRGVNGAVADAMVSNPPTTQSFGSQPIARVGGKDEALFRFGLDGIPSAAVVESATLTLYINGDASNAPLAIHRVTAPWSEASVTYASFGQSFDAQTVAFINPTSANAYKSVDVTSLARGWISGTAENDGLVIETSTQKKTIFVSSEGSQSQRPALQVCYSVPEDHCDGDPCEHGGTCTNEPNGFSCACPSAYTGARCETVVDNCAANPCAHGTCTSETGSYTCTCDTGYSGANCDQIVDNCGSAPCGAHGSCTNGIGTYTCACDAGYTGPNCDTIVDNCAQNPCVNGTCTNEVNSYTCTCADGFTGANCDQEIDHCTANACENGGTCVNNHVGYTCACAPGYTGPSCGELIDNCTAKPCLNGGTCENGVASYTCSCAAGYAGATCEIDINDCVPGACGSHGTCVDGVNSFTCACQAPYSGAACDTITPVDQCLYNQGALTELTGSFTIKDAATLAQLSCVDRIAGTLTIAADSSVTAIDLPVLTSVGPITVTAASQATSLRANALSSINGLVDIENNASLATVDWPGVRTLQRVYVSTNAALQRCDLGDVTTMASVVLQANPNLVDLGAVGLGHLQTVTNDIAIVNDAKLASLGPNGLSALTSVHGLWLQQLNALTSLGPTSLQALASGTGLFDIEVNPKLGAIDVSNARLAGLYISGNAVLASLRLGNLPTTLTGIDVFGNPLLNDVGPVGFANVETVTNDIAIRGTAVPELDFGHLISVGRNFDIESNAHLTTLGDLTHVTTIGAVAPTAFIDIESNALLASFDLSNATAGGFYIVGNPQLATARIGTQRPTVTYAVIGGNPNLADIGPVGYSTIGNIINDLRASNTKLTNLGPGGLSNVTTVGGGIDIEDNALLADIGTLSNLTSQSPNALRGGLDIERNPLLTTIDVSHASLSGWWIAGNASLQSVRLASTRDHVVWAIVSDNPQLTDLGPVGYSALKTVDTALRVRGTQVTSLGPTGLANLMSVANDLELTNNPNLADLGPTSLTAVTNIGHYLDVEQNPLLTDIDVHAADIGALWITNNPQLRAVKLGTTRDHIVNLNIGGNPLLSDLGPEGLSAIRTVDGDVRINNTALTTLGPTELTNLTTVGGAVDFASNSELPVVSLPSLLTVGTTASGFFEVAGNAHVTMVDAPALTSIAGTLYLNSNPALTTLHLDSLTHVGGSILINSNPNLPTCFATLLAQLVGYTGTTTIGGNGPACP